MTGPVNPDDAPVPAGGGRVVAATWAGAGVAHVVAVVVPAGLTGSAAAVSVTLAVAAAVGVVALLAGRRPVTLLVAAAAGAVGVASFLLPGFLGLAGIGSATVHWTDPWAFGAFVLDALVVRLAVFTLRRMGRVTG